ncbi:uncharacterized protein LOC113204894 isoform X3 [Frankliniella occidentalis]|uniref:Phosphodiesterase n=1 Tax=Frankliniella occidentalis TaxID=133901 RepID=A0A9C6X5N7_FRAOC|nr:uncharacterized protein LOC113204894 isoform X3 [Frankliniella occidentalis]
MSGTCGLCSLIGDVFRRLMCIGGSRRGSGESCYQELPDEEATIPNRTGEQSDGGVLLRVSAGGGTATSLSSLDWVLLGALDALGAARSLHTGRFLTMHKRRRRRPTTRGLQHHPALLDDIHHGLVKCVLDRVSLWPFNAFALDTVTGGRSLPVLCVHLFHWYGLMDHFKLDVVRVWKLFSLVEDGYHGNNPYHNSIHATDVTQAMHCFLQEEKIRKYLTPLEIMAALIAAVTHDLDHPGVNQPFLIATSNHLAALYENTSVLENHHWRSAVGCLLESNLADQLKDCRKEMEEQIASLILATDITRQQEFLTKFKKYLDTKSLDMTKHEDRHFILQIALKCADISNPCRPWDVSRKWSLKVCEEFFRQGDYERQLNLPITSLCDRTTNSVPKIQAGFFKFVVAPLFEEWHRFLDTPLSHNMINHLRNNQARWDILCQQEADQEVKTEISEAESQVAEAEKLGEEVEEEYDNVKGSKEHLLSESLRRPSLPMEPDQPDQPDQCTSGTASTIGRRHSVPLSRPSLPKTIVRTEVSGMTTDRGTCRRFTLVPVLHLEEDENSCGDVALDDFLNHSQLSLQSSCSSSMGGDRSGERPVSAENLLPEPSIASITTSTEASRLSTCGQNGCNTPPTPWTRPSRSNNLSSPVVDSSSSSAVKRHDPVEQPSEHKTKASKVARLSLSDPNGAEKISLAAAALRLQFKENVDPQLEVSSSVTTVPSVSNIRRNVPQGLVLRRGSAPVTLSPREDVPLGLPVSLRPGMERFCRRGSVPIDISRQSVIRPLASKENLGCFSPPAQSLQSATTSLNSSSNSMPRQSSLPHDLARQSLGLPVSSSPAQTPLTAPAGFGLRDSDGNCQKSVFWDPVGGILLWPQEKSKLPSNYSFSADLIHRLSAPDKKVRSPASTSVSVGASCVNRQLHYLDVRRSSVPTDISLELLRRLTEQPSVPGRSSSNNNNSNGKTRNSRVKKVLRRRSSGGPELFLNDCSIDSSTWQRWRREVLLIQRMGVTDPTPVLEPLLSRRRGSLPVEVLAATQSGPRSPEEKL